MTLHIEVTVHPDVAEPNVSAAAALEALAEKLRIEAPHDFITANVERFDAKARSEWRA